ncbi:restriction endonuclease subunit S [Alkalispirochaeta sphaeroplastigenens]|nr:restriction endonuclease subunit S [Alkalispirochaeta sphaeroplastigenens]
MSLLSIKNKIGIPSDWKMVPIGKVLISSQYGTSNGNSETGVPVVGMKNLQDGKVDFNDLPFVSVSNEEKESLLLHDGDILLNRTNSYDLVGKIGFVDKAVEAVFASYLVRLQVDRAKSDPKFVALWLTSFWADQMIKKIATRAVSQANVNPTEFKKFCLVPVLPQPEQKAIADLLSTWDEAIDKTEQLIMKKQKFYEAQLSKRLSSDVSERIKLKKFLKEVSKRNRDLSITQVLSVTNSKGFVRPEDQFDRQVASDNLSNYKIVSKGEYAYNPSRINVGSIARLDGWDVGVLSPMYTVFEIKKPSELHTDLFLHWLNSHEAKQRIKLSAQGSVRETVSFDDFCAIGFPKIDFNEQKSLAEFFSLISAEIDTLKALSDKYNTQKRGLMQKMLTGEWRVKPEIVNQYMEA